MRRSGKLVILIKLVRKIPTRKVSKKTNDQFLWILLAVIYNNFSVYNLIIPIENYKEAHCIKKLRAQLIHTLTNYYGISRAQSINLLLSARKLLTPYFTNLNGPYICSLYVKSLNGTIQLQTHNHTNSNKHDN